LFIACSGNNQQPPAKYEEKKASMEEIERESPQKFLKITGSHHGNLLNQTVVEGEITNKATLISYRNIQVQVSFLDKDGAVIEKEKEILDDLVKPGATSDFKIKTGHIKGANSVKIEILNAVADR
jgi:hypothetical protein